MTTPLVSVIIPAYNHERFIAAAINSVLCQTLTDFELIIIDDGSTDQTFDIIRSYTDPRIKAETQANVDAPTTLNRGMTKARGSYLAILNSDDLYDSHRLEIMIRFMKDNKLCCAFSDLQMINTQTKLIDSPRHPWNKAQQKCKSVYYETGDMLTTLFYANLMTTTSNLIITREAATQTGAFSMLRYLHDYDYIFRVARLFGNQVAFLDHVLLSYRVHRNNTLKQGAIDARLQDIELIRNNILCCTPSKEKKRLLTAIDHLTRMEKELQYTILTKNNPTVLIQKCLCRIYSNFFRKQSNQ